MKKLLVVGDSYMAPDQRSNGSLSNIHWAKHLESHFHVVNLAQVGASNALIAKQLENGIKNHKPDFIVLGFTSPFRLEFSDEITSCWVNHLTLEQKTLVDLYNKNVDNNIEFFKNWIIAHYCVQQARAFAPTVYTLNYLDFGNNDNDNLFMNCKVLRQEQLPLSLVGHKEWGSSDHVSPSFHVMDPTVHVKFTQQILNKFLTIS